MNSQNSKKAGERDDVEFVEVMQYIPKSTENELKASIEFIKKIYSTSQIYDTQVEKPRPTYDRIQTYDGEITVETAKK
jgi:hypothetical protein